MDNGIIRETCTECHHKTINGGGGGGLKPDIKLYNSCRPLEVEFGGGSKSVLL